MMTIRKSDVIAGLFASVPMLAGSTLYAQDVANTAKGSGVVLEEITVTAQKRTQNLQEVPIAITAFSSEQLEAMGIDNLVALASATPSLSFVTLFHDSVPSFSLRGISAFDYNANQSSPVATYIDEVYKGTTVLTALGMYDVERVEVLHGPQGTLFGKNTTGGAVSIHSRRPDLGEGFTGELRAGVGNYDRREASGAANIPLVDGVLAGRVAFTYAEADGYIENLDPDIKDEASTDDHAVRVSLLWQPSESSSFLLRLADARVESTGTGLIPVNIGIAGPGGVGFGTGYTREGLGFFETEAEAGGRVIMENSSVSLTGTWKLPSVTITSISSYDTGEMLLSDVDGDGSPFRILDNKLTNDVDSYAQDLRVASAGDGPFTWLVGAYYYHDRMTPGQAYRFFYEFAGDANGNGLLDCFDNGFTGCTYSNEFRQVRRSFALYTQGSYAFTDRLTLTAGLRYTDDVNELEKYEAFVGFYDPVSGQEVMPAAQTITAPPISRAEDDNVGGKLGLDFKLTPELMLYGNVSRGYRGAAFNGSALFSPAELMTVAPPERVDAFEIGAKSQWLEDRLRVNAAAFYNDYRDQQYIDATAAGIPVVGSIPKSRILGAELELLAKLAAPLEVRFSASYVDAQFREGQSKGVDLSGKTLVLAPEWTLNGGADWTVYDGSALSVRLHGGSRYVSRQFFDALNSPDMSQGAYWVHNARLTFTMSALSVAAWVNNLADEEYDTYKNPGASIFNFNSAQRGRPRQYGIEATYRF